MDTVYGAAKVVLLPPLEWGLRWTVVGTEHLPARGPVILASNHTSYLDPLALAYVANRRGRRVRFLAKAELFDKRGFGAFLRGAGQIPVSRGTTTAAGALDAAVDALQRGECVAVFPEGTISLDLEPMQAKSGTARLAQASGVPVIPVGLWGAHRILFKGRKPSWRWGVAEVGAVGPPVSVAPNEKIRDATDRVMGAICAQVARARELYPQRPDAADHEWWDRGPETAVLRHAHGEAG